MNLRATTEPLLFFHRKYFHPCTSAKDSQIDSTSDSLNASPLQPTLGIGSCLAGNEVRYNGQAKKPNEHVRAIAEHFRLRAFCPEMGVGMGVPRAPIHLVGASDSVRVLDVATHSLDYTDQIAGFAATVLAAAPDICGYVLVKGSPSCGYQRVKRFAANGHRIASDQQGIFAAALARLDPLLPVEDDGRLHDPALRESFVTRAYTYHQWKQLLATGISAGKLIDFYSRYKYLVMAHHVPGYQLLGRMLADAGKHEPQALAREFISALMGALGVPATRRSHTNVLHHMAGYLKRTIAAPERQRLAELIDQYRRGLLPLVVPVTLLQHHFANSPNAYIEQQVFMDPYPQALQLRNLI